MGFSDNHLNCTATIQKSFFKLTSVCNREKGEKIQNKAKKKNYFQEEKETTNYTNGQQKLAFS